MCTAVCYFNGLNHHLVMAYFNEARAALPVKIKGSPEYKLVPWGRRQSEKSGLPLGGWLSLSSFNEKRWDKFFPKPVKIVVTKFMELDIEGQPRWFDVTKGQFIQGAFLTDHHEHRAYIVTLTPQALDNPFQRWPRINCCEGNHFK